MAISYLKHWDEKLAAEEVGISQPTAAKYFKSPAVRALIDNMVRRRMQRLHIDTDQVVFEIFETAREARAVGKFDASAKLYRLLAEHLGMLPKVAVTNNLNVGQLSFGPPQPSLPANDDSALTVPGVELEALPQAVSEAEPIP